MPSSPHPKFWLVRTKCRRYGYITALAVTAAEAVAAVQRLGHKHHVKASGTYAIGSPGRLGMPVNITSPVVTPDGEKAPGWVVLGRAPDRRMYQEEIIQFLPGPPEAG